MILIDGIGHMVSTKSADELHEFAKKIGLKKSWYQTPNKIFLKNNERYAHYDLTTKRMKFKAKVNGAKLVTSKELLRGAWWYDD